MLIWLAEYLVQFHTAFNVFSYLTFRAIVGLLTSLIIALWMGPHVIAYLQRMQITVLSALSMTTAKWCAKTPKG